MKPSTQPSAQPSSQPSLQPTVQPSGQPTSQPSSRPSVQPSSQPSIQPSCQPSCQPSSQPSSRPSEGFVDWNVGIDTLDDIDISADEILEDFCMEDSWYHTQTRSGRCSFRIALKFCIFRAPWYLGTLRNCRVYFPEQSIFRMNSSMGEFSFVWSSIFIDYSHNFVQRSGLFIPYPVHVIIDGQFSEIVSTKSNSRFLSTHVVGNSRSSELMPWMESSIVVSNLFFRNNWASFVNGSVFSVSFLKTFEVINVYFSNQRTLLDGSSIFATEVERILIKNGSFVRSSAWNGGAASFSKCNSVIVVNSLFSLTSASNIGGSIVFDQVSDIHIYNSEFLKNSAVSFGGAIAISGSTLSNISHNDFLNCSSKYGSSIVLDKVYDVMIFENNFRNNSATCCGSIYWLTASMNPPVISNTSNAFDGNIASVYGADIATNVFRIKFSPDYIYVTDYLSGTFPIYLTLSVVDFYDQIIRDESNNIVQAWTYSEKAKCDSNLPRLFGDSTGILQKGVVDFHHLGASCYPGGSANITFSVYLSQLSALFPVYDDVYGSSLWNNPNFRFLQSNDLRVKFRRCVRGEIFDLDTVLKSTCSVCVGSFSLNDNNDVFATSCITCPSLARSCSGAEVILSPGTWRFGPGSYDIFHCPYSDSCKGGNLTGNELCNVGYSGPMCGICSPGYYLSSGTTCTLCTTSGQLSSSQLAQYGLVLVLVVAVVVFIVRNRSKKPIVVPGPEAKRSSMRLKVIRAKFMPRFQFLLLNYQIISSVFPPSMAMPSVGSRILSLAKALNFDVTSIFPSGCGSSSDYLDKLIIACTFPGYLVAGGLVFFVVLNIISHFLNTGASRELHGKIAKYAQKLTWLVLFSLYVLVPSISLKIFKVFDCVAINENSIIKKYLVSDLSMDCSSPRYVKCKMFADLMILVYPVGIPIMFFFVLYEFRLFLEYRNLLGTVNNSLFIGSSNPSKEKSLWKLFTRTSHVKDFLFSIKFLYDKYDPNYWFWDAIEIWRRLFLIAVLPSVIQSDLIRSIVGLLICLFFMKIYCYFEPFSSDIENQAANLGTTQIMILYFIGTIVFQSWISSSQQSSIISPILVVGLFLGVVVNGILGYKDIKNGLSEVDNMSFDDGDKIAENNEKFIIDHIDNIEMTLTCQYDVFLVRKFLQNLTNNDIKVVQSIVLRCLIARKINPSKRYLYYVDDKFPCTLTDFDKNVISSEPVVRFLAENNKTSKGMKNNMYSGNNSDQKMDLNSYGLMKSSMKAFSIEDSFLVRVSQMNAQQLMWVFPLENSSQLGIYSTQVEDLVDDEFEQKYFEISEDSTSSSSSKNDLIVSDDDNDDTFELSSSKSSSVSTLTDLDSEAYDDILRITEFFDDDNNDEQSWNNFFV